MNAVRWVYAVYDPWFQHYWVFRSDERPVIELPDAMPAFLPLQEITLHLPDEHTLSYQGISVLPRGFVCSQNQYARARDFVANLQEWG